MFRASNGFNFATSASKNVRSVNSRYLNFPMYSIKGKTITYKQVITKKHTVDACGQETPGVGEYSPPPYEFTKNRAPGYSVGS